MSVQSQDWRELCRFRAWELHEEKHWPQCLIAEALGVTQGAVSQWIKRGIEGGREALRHRKLLGRLLDILREGAEVVGFPGDVWTCDRVAWVIEAEFGVRYHPAHVSRILRACGWSQQKPICRARQRDAEAIERWLETRWPAVKKSLRARPDGDLYR
jgi:transposase